MFNLLISNKMKDFNFFVKPATRKQCIVSDAFRECIRKSKVKYVITSEKSMKQLYSDFINILYTAGSLPNAHYRSEVSTELSKLGISNSADIKEALLFIKSAKAPLFIPVLTNISFGKAAKKEEKPEYIGRSSRIGMDTARTIVVRSKYGTTAPMFYELNGSTSNVEEITKIKLQYHYDTGCKYYEARPILLSTWDTLDNMHKSCTCIPDTQD